MPEQTPSFTESFMPDGHEIRQLSLKAGLYLVATPIGNMRDITLRALDVLLAADIVACEDTRVSGQLFTMLGMKKKLMSYHDHNADQQRPYILQKIAEGQSVALISDAGMPLISDPGYKLVRTCIEQGVYVTSLPGANAPLMALQLSGLPSDSFSFVGFLPQKAKARCDALEIWKNVPTTLIIFESAARVTACIQNIHDTLGNRPMALTRELTKKFEDVWTGSAADILARLQQDGPPKGEIVLVVGQGEAKEVGAVDLEALLRQSMTRFSLKEAVANVAEATGLPKKQVYQQALLLKGGEEA